MRFRIEGRAKFKATEGSARAAMRLMIQRRGDTYSWDKASYRFWSRPVQLAPAEFVVEEALTPDRWTNVGGQTRFHHTARRRGGGHAAALDRATR